MLIEQEGCRHTQLVKWPLTFLLTCLNKYISKPVLFERAVRKVNSVCASKYLYMMFYFSKEV